MHDKYSTMTFNSHEAILDLSKLVHNRWTKFSYQSNGNGTESLMTLNLRVLNVRSRRIKMFFKSKIDGIYQDVIESIRKEKL